MNEKSTNELSHAQAVGSARNAWEELKKIDVNHKTETKGKFTYLSWAWAWGEVKNIFPEATYEVHDDKLYPDHTVEVRVSVTINGITHMMWLPVMDNKNNAISAPTAREINDGRMRCLVKAIAMHGLGHYIYAGEDIPETDTEPHTEAKVKSPMAGAKRDNAPPTVPDTASDDSLGEVVKAHMWKEEDRTTFKFNDWDAFADIMCSWINECTREKQIDALSNHRLNKEAMRRCKAQAISKFEDIVLAATAKRKLLGKGKLNG
tara:strand:- start:22148 stop:22933 length:786 start_codon:yes stop_codon:yes gene_type:complete